MTLSIVLSIALGALAATISRRRALFALALVIAIGVSATTGLLFVPITFAELGSPDGARKLLVPLLAPAAVCLVVALVVRRLRR